MPVLYKLLENIMMARESEYFNNTLSDLQGAAQLKCSSIHTSLVLQESIDYHVSKGANVYVAFLDIQKAFDTVWIPGMLYKLYSTGLDLKTSRLVKNAYEDFKCAAYVAGQPGDWFTPERGVHQGAPLSMKIYQVFINDLINDLRNSQHGAVVYNINVTAPTFADDIASIAFHKFGMNNLLKIANTYRLKWQFDFSAPKCNVMLWGRDCEPNVKIMLGGTPLKIVNSASHMGITLCTDRKLEQTIIDRRISAAQSIVLSARGIGSAEAPVPPTILSHLYWSVGVPKLVYGLEVTPISNKHVDEIDVAHRKFAKIVQGLPISTPVPAPLATIGWMSMKTYIAMRKIIFLWHLLCLPVTNIYRRVAVQVIINVGPNSPAFSYSPVKEMYRMAWTFGLGLDIWNSLVYGEKLSFDAMKKRTKEIIWNAEVVKWKASCLLYDQLCDYNALLSEIKNIAWWSYVRSHPRRMRQACCVVSLFLGAQPKGLAINFGRQRCEICTSFADDNPVHVLLHCTSLNDVRDRHLCIVQSHMPEAMLNDFVRMDSRLKCRFLLSGLNNVYVSEWDDIYLAITEYVWQMYVARHKSYTEVHSRSA